MKVIKQISLNDEEGNEPEILFSITMSNEIFYKGTVKILEGFDNKFIFYNHLKP